MGCNKSQPVSKIIQPPSLPFLSPKKRFSMTKNKLLTKGIKSMKEYFEIISALGTSGEGNLLYARDVHTGTYRTIREISKSTGSQNIKLLQEVNIISELDHPNILKVYQTIETNRSYYVVLENVDGGLLQNKIKKSGDEALVAKYMSEVFQAINYLHVNNIIHCNLHLGNILLSDSSDLGIPKIVGFRHSQRTIDMQDIDIKLLNYEYISPEILNYKFDEKTDIWSAGVILYMLLVGKLPFAGRSKKEVLESIFKCDLDFNNPNFLTLSYNARDLLKKILISDPYVRLSAKEILAHPWLAQSSKETSVTYEVIEKLRRFKIKTNIVRNVLAYLNFKINFKEHDIIALFKKLDVNSDGNVSKNEMIEGFKHVGIDCEKEIDDIMENLDMDQSGYLDFSELKIVLIDWEKEINDENLAKVFSTNSQGIEFDAIKGELIEILPSEWIEFSKKVKFENGIVPFEPFKAYIKANLVY